MRRSSLLGLIAAAGVAGCATQSADPAFTPKEMSWAFDMVEGQGPTLAYGKAETDDVPVMMTCARRTNRIELDVAVGSEHPKREISLESGGVVSTLPARYEEDALGPGLVAHTTAANPVLRRFADTGDLIVHVTGERMAARAADPSPVRKFLASCAG